MDSNDPRQGDYLPDVDRLYAVGEDGEPVTLPTPLGVVLISQCCDLARSGRGDVPVAVAVVRLNESDARNARSGRTPRYAPAIQLAEDLFVDFGITGAIVRDAVMTEDREGVNDTPARTLLAARVARRFSRFAYPDDIQPFIRRIQNRIRAKASSAQSPLGRCIERIQTIRVESDWDSGSPWALNLVFVLNEGELPTLEGDDFEDVPSQERGSISDIAGAIAGLAPGNRELAGLWRQLAEVLVADALGDPRAAEHVAEAIPEVLQESEFSYFRYRRSSDIDVDDLSDDDDA